MAGIPKSVAALNKWPYPFAKYLLGTRFYTWVSLLRDLYDDAKSRVLSNPALVQNTGVGTNVDMEHSAFDYEIDGAVYSKAAVEDIDVDAGAATSAGEYVAILVSIDDAGTVTQTVGTIVSAAPAPLPDKPNGDCVMATVQIPPSFVPGTTTFLTAWVTNGYAGRIQAAKPAVLPETDI